MKQCILIIIFFTKLVISYDRVNIITNKVQILEVSHETSRASCTTKPYLPKNSKVSCTRDRCNIECQKGYKFEDGTNFATLDCLGGQWKDSKTRQQLSLSDCNPTCVPPCKNGGRCISLNTCRCLKHFKGPICQYDINVCNITNTGFNGNIQCSSNNEATVCTLKCPEPSKFDKSCAAQYKCLYSSGEFLPKPIPKCILPPGSYLSNSKTSVLQYSSKLIGYSQNYIMNSSNHQKYNSSASMSSSWNRNYADSYHMETIEKMSLTWNKYQREFWKNGGMYLNWNEAQQELNRLANYKDMSSESSKFINEEREINYVTYFDVTTSYSMYTLQYFTSIRKKTVPKAGLCITWGGNNIKTFDGSLFKHSLDSAHTLVEDRIDGTFHVVFQGCLKGSPKCYPTLVIYWQNIEYTFENKDGDIELKSPRRKLQIPIQIMGMQVSYISQFLKINIDSIGISILWDMKKFIAIEASTEMWNKTAGLCGTLDSIRENDFYTKDGQVVKTVREFVDMWKVSNEYDESTSVVDDISIYNRKNSVSDTIMITAKTKCDKLLNNPKISECLNFYNKSILTAACIREYVNCPTNSDGACVCEYIEMIIKNCIFEGIKLNSGWRDLNICPMQCKKDRIYMPCGPQIELTCGNNPSGIETNICNEGCFCPKGTVQYKNKCISIEVCPCTLRNKEFRNGSRIQKSCNNCVCKSGIWKCSNNLCDARCSTINGLHYETFDGKRYDFDGKCSYYLLKTKNISIIAENFALCNSLSVVRNKRFIKSSSPCVKAIIINAKINNNPIKIKLKETQVAYVNDKEILNYPQILNNGLVVLRQASSSVVKVDIGYNVSVWWDNLSNSYIDISTNLWNKTNGLCGTFTSNIQDDFLTPEGDTETNVDVFANKWRSEHCKDLTSSTASKSRLHPCQQNPQNKKLALKYCGWILNATFEGCHWSVDPEPYYEDCLFDVCDCNKEFASCSCPILSAYGTECSRQGITTNWRNNVKQCGIKCPIGQVYNECGNSCLRTCHDLAGKSTCNAHCVDGCRCPDGQYLDENNKCIPASQCPCFFNGTNYNNGYKEVHPGQSFLELCTCVEGSWNCKKAELGDEEKYPMASQLKYQCKNLQFAEFVSCAPIKTKTCVNIDTYVSNYDNCKPGCVCKTGYVFDSTIKKCIDPKNCSCHHGGKQYQYGEEIKQDCNNCKCNGGIWKCTKNRCASTCSVWGDSHFTTFDKRDFDFQGSCDYILSQGYNSNGHGFAITIQNVVCGSLGVTCSKSVKINIIGKSNTTLTLSSDGIGKIKENTSNGSLIIYKAGVFIVIEDILVGIQVKWDRGTRVYLKLPNTWKNKVTGLCGNYNDDAKDDMKSPSFGIETSALSFGHSWKILDYCTMPTEQIDACKEHPERLSWAQKQCGILKSQVFQDCHNHVRYETYLKRCIFDTCACDQGGDCDCLCTAISAYAYACSSQGIHIKWRTPYLCPMQCDSKCSHYSACTNTCPITTCNNFLYQHTANLMCQEEQCLEGCKIKDCEKDLIYNDEKYMECVTKDKCKPICLQTIDGSTYYEGDIIESDECQTCYCSKQKKVCSGAPCSTLSNIFEMSTEANEYLTTVKKEKIINKCNVKELEYKEFPDDCNKFLHCQPQANGAWTYVEKTCGPSMMFNPKLNVCDHISSVKKIKPNCITPKIPDLVTDSSKYPEEYSAKVIKNITHKPEYSIQKVIKNTTYIPEHTIVKEIVLLKCDVSKHEYSESPENCHKFLHCQPQVDGSWSYVEKTCGPHMMFNPKLNICDHITNVKKIKESCSLPNIADISNEELPSEYSVKVIKNITYTPEYSTHKVIKNITYSPEYSIVKVIKNTTYTPEHSIEEKIVLRKCDVAKQEYDEFPGNCHKFLHCQPQVDGTWSYVEKTCGPSMMFNPNGNICDHIVNVKKIKPVCGEPEQSTMITVVKSRPEKISQKCTEGYIWSDCAYHCDHICHFYKHTLIKKGHCNHTSNCEEGCVHPQSINCLKNGKLWRDIDSCVSIDECPCMDHNGQMIKPDATSKVMKFGKCQMCQCIDNSIACNDCVHTFNTTYKTIKEPEVIITPISTDRPLIMSTSTTSPVICKTGSFAPIINGLEPLSDKAFSASSVLSQFFLPHYARFNSKPTNESHGSWAPLINDQMQYLQVSLPYLQPIYAIIIQGSPIFDQYVTLFKILYSTDGEAFHYLIDNSGGPQIFSGPINAKTAVKSFFKIPIEAKVLRIYPLKWHGSICIRFDIFGCENSMLVEKTVSQKLIHADTTIAPTIIETDYTNKPICYEDLGIEIGVIETNDVSASSIWPRIIHGKKPALVDMLKKSSLVGWRPALDSPNEFVSFDFKYPRNLTGIQTFGGPDGWVTAFNLLYSNDGHVWNKILNSDGLAKTFIGNHDNDTPKINYFKNPIRAQHLKIIPLKWKNTINLRIEPLGCLEKHPEQKEIVKVLESVKACLVCPDIEKSEIISDDKECKCIQPFFWDGDKCVERNECSCIDNHIKYAVGKKFENKECMNCVCVLGGIKQCKPKICPPCKSSLRPVHTKTCLCTCESCPEFQKLCPSSGDCIPEVLWCNGVKDCEDDENEDCSENISVINNNKILNMTKQCPDPSCPTGMEIMFLSNPEIKLSAMFQSFNTVTKQYFDDGSISITNKTIQQFDNSIPNINVKTVQDNNCLEFVCKPKQSAFSDHKIACNNFKCPENYEIQTDFDDMNANNCPSYTCKRLPKKDDICSIVGKIFKTFDGTEFKYEVCSHILARDIGQHKWDIKLYRNCSMGDEKCTKELKIQDKLSNIILNIQQNLKFVLHGYQYSAEQLQNSNLISSAFIISKPGETILIVSKKHGFWVSFNSKNEIKIGISSKFINSVDGLCGYYNGNPIDDKRLPDGQIADSTFKFGEGWSTKEILPKYCQPSICSKEIQENALKSCESLKNDTLLSPCVKSLNFKDFIPICVEKMCECFKTSKVEKHTSLSKHCKCSLLQSFVTDCLTAKPNLELDNWRYIHKCEISCKSPLIYKDCYKKRCEPSCDSLEECPVLPNFCLSGCFCPEGTVKNENRCVPITECKNCVCKKFGLANFITYDKQNLTLKQNCNYLISRDKISSGDHNFQIFGSHECKKNEFKLNNPNCFNVLHLILSKNVVSLKTYTNSSRKLLIDGEEININNYFKNRFISIKNSNEDLIIYLETPQVEIISKFKDLSLTIKVSNIKYQGQLEGVCGNCGVPLDNSYSVKNDKSEISKILKKYPKLMIHEKKLHIDNIECQSKNTTTKNCVVDKENSCSVLLDRNIFGQCHNLVEPSMYLAICQEDLCSKRTACTSISAYARECANNGVCIDWRKTDFCPYECPVHLQYKSCGCPKTCDDLHTDNIFDVVSIDTNTTVKSQKQMLKHCSKELQEGCFCSNGKFLHDNKCVLEKECIKCDGVQHYYGDIWQKDKCTECKCNRLGKVECTKKICQIDEIICAQGFKQKSETNEDNCCPAFVCVPHRPANLSIACPELLLPKCSAEQKPIQIFDLNNCPQYICECLPSPECKTNKSSLPLKPGEKIIKETVNCCPINKIICDKSLCPKKPLDCDKEFHEVIENTKIDSCCPSYECVLPKNLCLTEINKKPTIKKLGEKWLASDPCFYNVCTYGINNDHAIIVQEKETCANTKCDKDSKYLVDSGQCCGKCVQTMCEYDGIIYKPGEEWHSKDKCTSFSCSTKNNKTLISSFTETCPTIKECPENMKIKKDCCTICEIPSEPYKNCAAITVPEVETVHLVETLQMGHGVCVNKKPLIGFKECAGNCLSGTKYKKDISKFQSYCNCCSAKSYQTLNVTLTCYDGFVVTTKVEVPSVCECKPCTAGR